MQTGDLIKVTLIIYTLYAVPPHPQFNNGFYTSDYCLRTENSIRCHEFVIMIIPFSLVRISALTS